MKTITKQNYYAIIGLLELAKTHNSEMNDIERALMKLTGEPIKDYHMGHCGDAVWSGGEIDARELLKKLDVKVK